MTDVGVPVVSVGVAAALGGRVGDSALMRLTDVTYAFPDLLFIILLRSVLLGRHMPVLGEPRLQVMLAIALVNWTTIARLVRGQMLSLAEREYVTAARTLGASNWRIVTRHMLPNTLGPVIVAFAYNHMSNVWILVFPAGAIALLMLCFTFLGDGLRDALDPRQR
ncbi:MAG: ABC transporter permease [Dehalococcoidia bacterium]